MKARIVYFAALGLWGCSRPPPQPAQLKPKLVVLPPKPARPAQPAIALDGSFSDGTPLNLEALKGRPWVVNLWLPG